MLKFGNIEGETKIFKNKQGFYTTSISKKNQDGSWATPHYISVGFRKGVELENGEMIVIKSAWYTYDAWEKDGRNYTKEKLFVNEFEKKNGTTSAPVKKQGKEKVEEVVEDEDDLPF